MTPSQLQKKKEERVRGAMQQLVGHPAFETFMGILREHKDACVLDACSDRVVSNKRRLLATLGEVRCYEGILSLYAACQEQAAGEPEAE